jgi:hypothetical protein
MTSRMFWKVLMLVMALGFSLVGLFYHLAVGVVMGAGYSLLGLNSGLSSYRRLGRHRRRRFECSSLFGDALEFIGLGWPCRAGLSSRPAPPACRTSRALSRSWPVISPASRHMGAAGAKYPTEPSRNWWMVAGQPAVAPLSSVTSLARRRASWRRALTPFRASCQARQLRSPGDWRQWGQLRMLSRSFRTGTV